VSNTAIPETQFSIYKIDTSKVIETFFPNEDNPSTDDMLRALINSIEKILRGKGVNCAGFSRLKYKGYSGVVFKTIHEPIWKSTISQMIINNKSKKASSLPNDFLFNTNISYVLFHTYNECVYAMTGGYGSFYINKFVERNYGLYLLPKILKKDNPVVKHITENNLTGNRTSTHRTNRTNTSFTAEQDLSSIYKELNVEIDRSIATAIGIEFDKEESLKKKVNLINKDSLVIRRSLSLSNLSSIISKLNRLEAQRDNFALNYLVLAKKKGIKKSDLTNQLIEDFANQKLECFILIGDDYEKYVLNVDRYRVLMDDGNAFLDKTTPITLIDIFDEILRQKIRLSKNFVSKLLKNWQIETTDKNGNRELYPRNIIDVIQGFVEYGDVKKPCYLINGDWYIFDDVYSDILNKEYEELYNFKIKLATALKKNKNLDKPAANEAAYNEELKKEKDIIVSHTALYQNVEIADAIFWDASTLYLMHNKGTFNGIGARDLLNQILTAAECLQNNRTISSTTFLSQYYQTICQTLNISKHPAATKSEFIRLFREKKICFVAGFLDGFKRNSQSVYAKYLTIEANKKLSDKGFDYIPLGIH